MTTYTRKAFYGFLWVGIGAVLAQLFGYLLRLLLARSLSVEEYGLIYAVMALFGLVSAFQHLGLGEALARFTSAYSVKREFPRIKEIVLWTARVLYVSTLALALVAFLLADWLGAAYFKTPLAPALLRIFTLAFLLSPIDIILLALLQGRQRLDLHAVYTATRSIVLFLATWALLAAGVGLRSAMLAYLVAYALSYALFLPWFLRRAVPGFFSLRVRMRKETLSMLFAYGIPVMLTSVAGTILFYTDTLLITLFSSLHEVGIYQAALPTANILMFFVAMLTTVLLPMVAELHARRLRSIISLAVEELYLYVFLFMLPFVIATVIYPDLILNLLFGASFVVGANILRALALAVLFLALHAINAATLSGMGRPKDNTKAVVIGAVCNLSVNLVLIPRYGGLGAAIGTLISAVVMFCISSRFIFRSLRVRLPVMAWSKALVASALFSLLLMASRQILPGWNQYLKVVLVVAVGALFYVVALVLLRVVTLGHLQDMRRRILFR